MATLEIMATILQTSQLTNPFLHVIYVLRFSLSAFFILSIIELSLCFDAFRHQVNVYACLVCACIYYWVYLHF